MKTRDPIEVLLQEFRPDAHSPHPVTVQKALFLARRLQERAAELQTPAEKRQQAELDRMLHSPQDKATLTQMTDQAFRSHSSARAVDQFTHILDVQGVPRFFSPLDRTLLKGFQSFGGYLPGVAVPLVKERMRHETANVILPAEPETLAHHLRARRAEGVRMNVNHLGEAILGEAEARRRLEMNLAALQLPETEVISVKISTLYSQISALAREHTVGVLCDRLELLFRTAAHHTFTRADGTVVPKFVYLDMEEYRDLSLTLAAFMRTLDRPGLERASAGVVLQAYIPDSARAQRELNDWARRRVATGGAPVTLRIVKGANMEMERVEAALRGWPQAPFKTKLETDTNYKRMVNEGMKPTNLAAVRLGIASHNLFDLAYGLVLATEHAALDRVQFEMLEGMANHQRRAVFELSRNLLLYAPVCRKEDFIHAIGYLIRRLDENTGPDNFLRHAFKIHVGSPEWQRLEEGFVKSFVGVETLSDAPRRTQDRNTESGRADAGGRAGFQPAISSAGILPAETGSQQRAVDLRPALFVNEPDTDFSLPQNGEWAQRIVAKWKPLGGDRATRIPLVVDGEAIHPTERDGSRAGFQPVASSAGILPAEPVRQQENTGSKTSTTGGQDARQTSGRLEACPTTPLAITALPFVPFDPQRPVTIRGRRLPHWRQEGATYFVTFRLADSLPQAFLEQWLRERDEWLRRFTSPLTPEQREEFARFFFAKLDNEIDRGHGECVLRHPAVAEVVEQTLRHFDGERYLLGSFAIMPNHVHALVRPVMGHELSKIQHSWKSFAATAINQALNRSGQLWQEESFDHIVRDERQLERIEQYIADNPTKARLPAGSYRVGGGLAVRETSRAGFQPAASSAGILPAEAASKPPDAETKSSIPRRQDARGTDGRLEACPTAASAAATTRETRACLDPSRPGVVVGRYTTATEADIERALACAVADGDGWRLMPAEQRYELLGGVAEEIRRARADLIGAALADGGKTIAEADPEVSEAVDFVEFYRESALRFQQCTSLRARGKGVVVVVSPWNFPIAIPCGGIAAALAAGNTVILKPASDTVLLAWELCECFWRAGVSRRTLQFVPCSGGGAGRALVSDSRVDAVILTGGTDTARAMLRARPEMHLLAETGGKNATIVTALADRDQAIKHVLHSAFSHSGQKCSATSLLLLEAEVYDDPGFKRALCDAVESLIVGPAWELQTRMGPLIRPPSGDLELGLKVLEPGESWAVLPHHVGDNANLWSPAVKWGVQPGSFTHLTELFGPVLGVMRFEKLSEAIALVNETGYGLTSGLESLDDREQEQWKAGIHAGNLYVNRPTTGALVLRQPFGGMGKSAFGPGIKAGGPNYVAQLMDFTEPDDRSTGSPAVEFPQPPSHGEPLLAELCEELLHLEPADAPATEVKRLLAAIASYGANFRAEFGHKHDDIRLLGQDNIRRYLPVRDLRVRIAAEDTFFECFARVCAARIAGCRITVSVPMGFESATLALLHDLTEPWAGAIEFVEETDTELAGHVRAHQTDRVRYASPGRVPRTVRVAAAETGLFIADAPVLAEGRVELLWYVREQSLSSDYHRYGNLGPRAGEVRAEVI